MYFLSTGHLLSVHQRLSKLPNNFAAPFWRGAATLTHSIFACGFLSVVTFLICKNPDHQNACDSILPIFCNGQSPWLSYVCVHTGNFTDRNKGKPLIKHNPPHPRHQKYHTLEIRTPCADHSLEEPRVAQTQPSAGQEETPAEQSAGAHEGKLGKSRHTCPNKAHVSTIRQTANHLHTPNPKSLNSLWDTNNPKSLQSRG